MATAGPWACRLDEDRAAFDQHHLEPSAAYSPGTPVVDEFRLDADPFPDHRLSRGAIDDLGGDVTACIGPPGHLYMAGMIGRRVEEEGEQPAA